MVKAIDRHLPGGGLTLGALHEVAGGGNGAINGAAAALFAAGVAARTRGKVLWCITRPDLFAPALAQAGLLPDRVIYVEAGDETSVLVCFEEGLRHGGLGAVVAEVARLSMTASRRLQLAAENSGTIGIAIRRWRRHTEGADFGQPRRNQGPRPSQSFERLMPRACTGLALEFRLAARRLDDGDAEDPDPGGHAARPGHPTGPSRKRGSGGRRSPGQAGIPRQGAA
jgi:protein ImuA